MNTFLPAEVCPASKLARVAPSITVRKPAPLSGEAAGGLGRVRISRVPRALALALLCGTIAAIAGTSLAQQTPAPQASENRIEAEATNLHSSNGSFACSLYNGPKGFPKTEESVVANSRIKIKDRHAICLFDHVQPGDYAVAAMHDENDDGKMDYNFLGIPTEGYGFSSGATATFSAPSFDAAKFRYNGGVLRVPITLKY